MSASEILVTGVGIALPGVDGPADLLRTGSTAGEPEVDPAALLGKRGLRYKDRASRLALCAAADGLRAAGLLTDALTVPGSTVGVAVSSNLGNLDTVCEVADGIKELGVDGISPMGLPNASSNVVASTVAIRYGLRGPNLMVCNGATSGLDAVYWAASSLAAGRAERFLVIGVETDNRYVRGLLGLPTGQLLDGAVALVVERADAAAARGAAGSAVLGRYAREGGIDQCLDRLVPEGGAVPATWFVPEGHRTGDRLPAEVPRTDLSEVFGRASGALGVLQVAAAVSWFAASGPDAGERALVMSGTGQDDAVAGLLLAPAGPAA
ncbi:beta-ketoacyl synthase N-terminal-like domain-containing protein [Streptomyces sp. CA-278952]|uniref:beta-ketoacyl synthase N-terminal-like domain-containing protein n=1 Tax=Streptomyces sp. CA-278952 TaxID=2980556 RepID=UPI0023689C33|nr:beta-ketoacyl synthase N-terminal-like domain-containing protein [Streptomyces sp. CA-278952]WDG27639.1 beta-ketoacyl synthase N-terminal-like domain-containing protein [Streptomyces sp. CA-278952]